MFVAALVFTGAFSINKAVGKYAHSVTADRKFHNGLRKRGRKSQLFQINGTTHAFNFGAKIEELSFVAELQNNIIHNWVRISTNINLLA